MPSDLCLGFGQENVHQSGPFRKSRETGIRAMSQPGNSFHNPCRIGIYLFRYRKPGGL